MSLVSKTYAKVMVYGHTHDGKVLKRDRENPIGDKNIAGEEM